MRVARVGFLFAIGVMLALATPGGVPAATTPAGPSFKVTISPEYATAGQRTTFQVTVVNTSSAATVLGSVTVTPPAGFTPPHAAPGTSLRAKTKVQRHTLSLQRIALTPGTHAQLAITSIAPSKCGRALLHWKSQAFEGATGSGAQLALNSALSRLGVTVLCPAAAACGDGGPPCSTKLVTSGSTYAVVSDAPSGTLRQTVNVGHQLTCGSYRFRDANWYDSVVVPPASPPPTGTAPTTPIVDTVTYTIRNATAKGIGFCLGVAYQFTTASGVPARAGKLPTGSPGFAGLLPRCAGGKPPCISSVTQRPGAAGQGSHDVLLKIKIAENGDPWGRA